MVSLVDGQRQRGRRHCGCEEALGGRLVAIGGVGFDAVGDKAGLRIILTGSTGVKVQKALGR